MKRLFQRGQTCTREDIRHQKFVTNLAMSIEVKDFHVGLCPLWVKGIETITYNSILYFFLKRKYEQVIP